MTVSNHGEIATEYGIDDTTGKLEYFPWYRGGGLKPQTGKDLGVYETSLEDRANCVSIWLLGYLNPLLSLGSHKVLDAGDVGVPSRQDSSDSAFQKTKETWDEQILIVEEQNKKILEAHKAALANCKKEEDEKKIKAPVLKEPSVAKALMKSFGGYRFYVAVLYYVISSLLSFVPVLILNDLVSYFEHVAIGSATPYNHFVNPWVEVAGLGIVPLIVSLLQTRHQAIMAHCGVYVRTSVSTLLYQKSLNVSAAGRAKTSTGQVVNMMSNDTMQLQRFLQFIGMTMGAPLQIIIALYLIYGQVSTSPSCYACFVMEEQGSLGFLLNSHFIAGWKCNLGWCCLHGLSRTHQYGCLFCCKQNEKKGTQVF